MNFFPKNLRYLRRKLGQNQAQLSSLVNKKQNTIGNWENAVSEPGIRELSIIAQYFGVSLEALVSVDLEHLDQADESKKVTGNETTAVKREYKLEETSNTLVSEESQDQFWVVVRELRRISEKLDSIQTQLNAKERPVNLPPRGSGL